MSNQTVLVTLQPVVALLIWSMVMWVWMYATRLPAMSRAKVVLDRNMAPKDLTAVLPPSVRWKADNYNHLMEAPTLFYAATLVVALASPGNVLATQAAWAYVGLRVLHSLVQALTNHIPARFTLFILSSLALIVVIWQVARAVFGV